MSVARRAITQIQEADDYSSYVLLEATNYDAILKTWCSIKALLSSITRTDYSATRTLYNGDVVHAGCIHVMATVTWPDGSTGHLDGVEYPEQPSVLQYWTASHVGSGRVIVQAPLVDGVAGLSVITPDYYLDSTAGAGGAGTLASPFKTFAELPALVNGDVLALKSGSHWRETLEIEDGISVYRYGAGAKPIIDCSDVISGTWTNDGTYTNLWYIDVAPDDAAGLDVDTNLWVNGVYPVDARSANLTAANGGAGRWYVDDDVAATQRIYYYPTASNPNADGKLYEFNSRADSITGNKPDDVVLDGLVCRRQREAGGSVRLGEDAITRHCDFLDGTKHNFMAEQGWKAYGCRFVGAMSTSPSITLSVYNQDRPTGIGIWNYDCYWDSERTSYAAATGAYGHYNVSGAFGPVLYDRCTFNRLAGCIDGGSGSFTGITVRRCVQWTCTSFVICYTAGDNTGPITIDDNFIIGPGAGRFAGLALPLTYYIRNNYIYVSGLNGALEFAGGTAYVYGNELETDGTIIEGSRVAIRLSVDSTAVIRCYENKFLGSKDGSNAEPWGFYWYNIDETVDVPRIYTDLNHYGDATGVAFFGWGVFNAAISAFPGTAITNVSGLAGVAGDGSQEARALIFS